MKLLDSMLQTMNHDIRALLPIHALCTPIWINLVFVEVIAIIITIQIMSIVIDKLQIVIWLRLILFQYMLFERINININFFNRDLITSISLCPWYFLSYLFTFDSRLKAWTGLTIFFLLCRFRMVIIVWEGWLDIILEFRLQLNVLKPYFLFHATCYTRRCLISSFKHGFIT